MEDFKGKRSVQIAFTIDKEHGPKKIQQNPYHLELSDYSIHLLVELFRKEQSHQNQGLMRTALP